MKIEISKEQKDKIVDFIFEPFLKMVYKAHNCAEFESGDLITARLFNEFFEIGDAITGIKEQPFHDINTKISEDKIIWKPKIDDIEIKCKSCGLVMLYDVDVLGVRDILEGKE